MHSHIFAVLHFRHDLRSCMSIFPFSNSCKLRLYCDAYQLAPFIRQTSSDFRKCVEVSHTLVMKSEMNKFTNQLTNTTRSWFRFFFVSDDGSEMPYCIEPITKLIRLRNLVQFSRSPKPDTFSLKNEEVALKETLLGIQILIPRLLSARCRVQA